jgi:hypothetical protein
MFNRPSRTRMAAGKPAVETAGCYRQVPAGLSGAFSYAGCQKMKCALCGGFILKVSPERGSVSRSNVSIQEANE